MADNQGDFRNPKIQDTGSKSSNSIGKWIGIALAALVALLLLLWLLGTFDSDETVVTDEQDSVVVPAD